MLMTTLTMIILLSVMFLYMNHPLAMGLMLLLQTLLISIYTGLMLPSFWFSYVLFLVFLGGMLVLFIYVTSLASNEMFSLNPKLVFVFSVMMFIIMTFMYIMNFYNMNCNMKFNMSNNMLKTTKYLNESIFKMYDIMAYPITVMMILYLLLTLVIIVNIVAMNEGPLRPIN
uniref:NADH-ubiquinone oxidoreductase chain 6 n=1 Tax=Caenis robusta TaxID=446426 RepID=A0A7D7ADQ5_9INSE|nr:NADH dehydrogenase subunit 6 [Caenis robusta]UJG45446.1 NADH dehydrogenase subunit 6 [Caenis robusta]